MLLNQLKSVQPGAVTIDTLKLGLFNENNIQVDVLRLDKIHPVISGNKWFKLKYYLQEALENNLHTLLTFGGAYSNHIIAVASAANEAGIASVGIIRGDRPQTLSATLQDAEKYGMHLQFISRDEYKQKNDTALIGELTRAFPGSLIIPEGGSGANGLKGSAEILSLADSTQYSHIICAIGTGTMYCGLINSSGKKQKIIGICVLKGMSDLLLQYAPVLKDADKINDCVVKYDYHFGGYAKKNIELIDFMNTLYIQTGLPTDFVYTGKLLYAVTDLVQKKYFPVHSRLLVIHSGGLQGNASLPRGMLAF